MSLTNLFISLKLQITKNIGLVNLSIYYTWKNIESAYSNNKFKISAPTLNDKQFGQLTTISPHSLTMLKTTNAEFQSIKVWFTNQNNRSLEIEHSVYITILIG